MSTEVNYSFIDRAVHRLAFGKSGVQTTLCDLELRLYKKQIQAQSVEKPIFVTSLARAGTTLILEILSRHPDVVTHSYRDMPFVLSPVIWRKFMGRFRVSGEQKERAHSDGLLISTDSSEAFEEVLWLKHCADHYTKQGISPWSRDDTAFGQPLTEHIQRLIASRDVPVANTPRYLSKNNANIARFAPLREVFPDASFVVPLRDPLDHAMSLFGQHQKFLEMHAQSGFARDYMCDIGHFEFGSLHKPILFGDMQEVKDRHTPSTPEYWLAYWVAAHRNIMQHESLIIVDMSAFTKDKPVAALLEALELGADSETLEHAHAQIREIKRYAPGAIKDEELLKEASEVHEILRTRSQKLS